MSERKRVVLSASTHNKGGACEGESAADSLRRDLRTAVRNGNLPGVREALDNGAHPDAVERMASNWAQNPLMAGLHAGEDANQDTALMLAARLGDLRIAKELLGRGASPARTNLKGLGPIECAARAGDEAMLGLILEAAEAPAKETLTHALESACSSASEACVRRLLEAGARVEGLASSGVTPLQIAIEKRARDVVDVLIEAGALDNPPYPAAQPAGGLKQRLLAGLGLGAPAPKVPGPRETIMESAAYADASIVHRLAEGGALVDTQPRCAEGDVSRRPIEVALNLGFPSAQTDGVVAALLSLGVDPDSRMFAGSETVRRAIRERGESMPQSIAVLDALDREKTLQRIVGDARREAIGEEQSAEGKSPGL